MSKCGCDCKCNCAGRAIVASIIIGIIAAILRVTAVITLTPIFLWVVFGIAVAFLGLTLLSAAQIRMSGIRRCVCSIVPTLLTGILGTILTSVILLAIEFVATSIIGAIITGALIAFFTLMITSAACLIKCVVGCSFGEDEE